LPAGRGWPGARFAGGQTRQTYGYDAIDQVTSSNYGAAGAESFAYDPMGNRTTATLLGQGTVNYTANALNQYTTLTAGSAGFQPAYDTNGNLLTARITTGAGPAVSTSDFTLGYDGQSRLTSALRTVTDAGGTTGFTMSVAYDARNRQINRTVDGVTTYFIWDNWSLLAEYRVIGGTPVQQARYVHGPRLDEILLQQRTVEPTPVYLHEDALGSTYLLTDATGAPVERYAYTAFGEVSAFDVTNNPVATPTTRFLYTGREWIAELRLNDHRNRFYMPSLGRWPSRDPIGERGGLNLYGYVLNNPIRWVDPLGLEVFGTYDQGSGMLALTDEDTGETVVGRFESGGKPYGDSIPTGNYEILDHPNPDFFRLDSDDGSPRDDVDDRTGRDRFRLHKPGRTVGCIASKDKDEWDKIRDFIRKTKTTPVTVSSKTRWGTRNTEPSRRFGEIRVIPPNPHPPAP
jgi:RHS repeat-associated protein